MTLELRALSQLPSLYRPISMVKLFRLMTNVKTCSAHCAFSRRDITGRSRSGGVAAKDVGALFSQTA